MLDGYQIKPQAEQIRKMVNLDSKSFFNAFAGGIIIGIASSAYLLLKGRITGISGILHGVVTKDSGFHWKSSFISGMLLTGYLAFRKYGYELFDTPDAFGANLDHISLAISGLLVGFGTKLGNGCTSGHGVCGLPRFSKRSFAAVCAFMCTGFLTATLRDRLFPTASKLTVESTTEQGGLLGLVSAIGLLGFSFVTNPDRFKELGTTIISFLSGSLFSVGLLISGMVKRSKVMGFLTLNQNWDPSLMFVMGGAVLFNFIAFHYIINVNKEPILHHKLELPAKKEIDWKLLVGASLFGMGWGVGGMCPGPAVVSTTAFIKQVGAIFLPALIAGQYAAKSLEESGICDSKESKKTN